MKTYHELPSPNAKAAAKSDALRAIIAKEIGQSQGLISFSRFMELALYHPEFGYYQNPDFKFGKDGDFTTASEISPLYAYCFARQCLNLFTEIGHSPILELGAGSGKFALNFLEFLDKKTKITRHYYIYEPSLALRKQQQHFILQARPDFKDHIIWLTELPETFQGIIIANEVLDAIPFNCFTVEESSGKECMVSLSDNQLIWQTATTPLQNEINKLISDYQLPEGYRSEININASAYTAKLCDILTKGVILFADYGYGQAEYYHPARKTGTLSCFYQHLTHQQPLLLPGLQDITAHVDFTRMIETAADKNCHLLGYTTQSAFLLANGLLQEALELETGMSESDAFALHQEIKLLTMPMEMGDRVKIMAIGRGMNSTLNEFKQVDRRRDL